MPSIATASQRDPTYRPSVISVTDLEKRYWARQSGEFLAIEHFDLEIRQEEFFCLLGPSGCGKTTVLNVVAGFERPSKGSVRVGGSEVCGPGPDRGVVFQGDDSLFNWLTALQNVEFGPRMRGIRGNERRARAEHYLELVGLRDERHKYPSELSGGMRQRIQIARTLANEPRVLLMDEPFGALDAQTRSLMQEQLLDIWRQTKTCALFVTHDIEEAVMLGTRIGVMSTGPAATLKMIVDVDLRERHRTDQDFMRVYSRVYDSIREEVLRQRRPRPR
jgi:NitT/TauT family transport system ATP-binding protein